MSLIKAMICNKDILLRPCMLSVSKMLKWRNYIASRLVYYLLYRYTCILYNQVRLRQCRFIMYLRSTSVSRKSRPLFARQYNFWLFEKQDYTSQTGNITSKNNKSYAKQWQITGDSKHGREIEFVRRADLSETAQNDLLCENFCR